MTVTVPEADYSTGIQQELTTQQNSIYFGEFKIFSYFEGGMTLLKTKIPQVVYQSALLSQAQENQTGENQNPVFVGLPH